MADLEDVCVVEYEAPGKIVLQDTLCGGEVCVVWLGMAVCSGVLCVDVVTWTSIMS